MDNTKKNISDEEAAKLLKQKEEASGLKYDQKPEQKSDRIGGFGSTGIR